MNYDPSYFLFKVTYSDSVDFREMYVVAKNWADAAALASARLREQSSMMHEIKIMSQYEADLELYVNSLVLVEKK